MVTGATWTEEYDSFDGAKTTHMIERWSVVATDELVTVAAGTFRTSRLHRRNENTNTNSTYWFAAGVGKVKEESPPKEHEELVSFHVRPSVPQASP